MIRQTVIATFFATKALGISTDASFIESRFLEAVNIVLDQAIERRDKMEECGYNVVLFAEYITRDITRTAELY